MRQQLDIVEKESVARKQRGEAVERMIEKMLMIDRVEFARLNHVDGVGHFEGGDPIRLQEPRETSDEIVDLVDMRENVVGNEYIYKFALLR